MTATGQVNDTVLVGIGIAREEAVEMGVQRGTGRTSGDRKLLHVQGRTEECVDLASAQSSS